MKKLILFVFVLVVGNVKGQTYYPCSVLPGDLSQWCYTAVYIDTLNIAEDSALIEIDTANSCSTWMKGHSYKSVFDSATAPYGIVTDTLLSYGTDVKCSFTLKQPVGGNVFWGNPVMLFEHKYETDSLLDGGYLEYSCDNGQNWTLVGRESFQYQENYYNFLDLPDSHWNQTLSTIHDTIPAFTGTNGQWQWSGLQLIFYMAVLRPLETRWQQCEGADTLYIRFNFESDGIDNGKAGWMIRNIVLAYTDIGGSISEFSTLPLKLFPNPATEKISIELPPNSGKLSSVVISDIAGNVALRATKEREIDVSSLSPGIYFVLAETDKFVFRQKLVKQ